MSHTLGLAQIALYDQLQTILPSKEAALELSQALAPWLADRLNSMCAGTTKTRMNTE